MYHCYDSGSCVRLIIKKYKRRVAENAMRFVCMGENGMINLLLAIASSSLVSIVMRTSEKCTKGNHGMIAVNYVICVIMAAFYTGFGNLFPKTEGIGFTLGLGGVTGVIYLVGLLLVKLNIQKNGVVLTSIFQKLGLLVQLLISIVFFKEQPEVIQIVGIVLCLIAVIMINFEKGQTAVGFKLGLFLILLNSGLCDGMSKVHEELGNPALAEHFLFYTFGVALILCVVMILGKKESFGWKDIGFGILLGVPNYFSASFLLKALNDLAAVIVFPTFSVATVVVISMTGLLVFKEKLSKKQWISMGFILIALVLLNV